MRTSDCCVAMVMVGVALAFAPAPVQALDAKAPARPGTVTAGALPVPPTAATLGIAPVRPNELLRAMTPVEAFRSGAQALRAGETARAVSALEYAAERGLPAAQWKLARMYAEGEGVTQNDLRAYEYFTRIANANADDLPNSPQGRLVAKAFVALGHYHLDGIANSAISPDPERARQMFGYAASYFGDQDAQYHLGRLYLEGMGGAKDERQAARWLQLSAQKGHYRAQATLGALLFTGGTLPRQAARGLMWLTLGRDAAGPEDGWIKELYDTAFRQATADQRAMALVYLEQHLKGRR